jgi:hypothetical protein
MPASPRQIDGDPTESPIVDVARPNRDRPPAEALMRAVTASGTGTARLLQDYARLAFGPGRLSFNDYIRLRLFDEQLYGNADKRAFVGARANRDIAVAVNYRHDWFGMVSNKIAAGAYLRTYGLPTIPLTALYAENLGLACERLVRTPDALLALLRQEAIYPLFGKPVESYQSLGSASLRHYRPGTDSLVFIDGREIKLMEFVTDIRAHYAQGYLFQPLVLPQATIRGICGDRLATVRILTMATEAGPKIARASWKIPAGENSADNYWRSGNVLAQINPQDGTIGRTFTGSGFDLQEISTHPDSQQPFRGFQLPDWDGLCAIALEGARVMRHMPLIGWDMAASEAGPLIVEMNETPDFFLHQLADSRGMLDPDFNEFIAYQKAKSAQHVKSVRTAVDKL